jgi:hypothetical protein
MTAKWRIATGRGKRKGKREERRMRSGEWEKRRGKNEERGMGKEKRKE